MTFKLFFLVFCAFQLASCATVDEEYQAYLKEYQRLTNLVADFKRIVTDDLSAIRGQSFIQVETKINTTNDFLETVQDAGSLEWGEPGLSCVNDQIEAVRQATAILVQGVISGFQGLQILADYINAECDNSTAVTQTMHASIETDWWLCTEDDIPCKRAVVKNANDFVDVFLQEHVIPLYERAVEFFRDAKLPFVLQNIQFQINMYTSAFVDVISEIKQCWDQIV